ncbi:hypothetical protein [Nostoc sp. ATCC 53789]|uniref:hypothetical protein n=1 Tax=Nostoc sp. ATCC 53789 TaxID=76335 RepID=UPI0011BED83C|nr:hypothetical protein [Nostoc sp. ATCC 53789]QHG14642.1 hypothetical protein GJB62_00605 [Nostoc sp. ATCC 53789]
MKNKECDVYDGMCLAYALLYKGRLYFVGFLGDRCNTHLAVSLDPICNCLGFWVAGITSLRV